MLRNLIILTAAAGLAAFAMPAWFAQSDRGDVPVAPRNATSAAPQSAAELRTTVSAASGRKVRIEADANGHFQAEIKINGRKIDGLIDTGATLVALNVSTARRLGIAVPQSEFRHEVNTANGKTRAAVVTLSTIEIGRIRVENVDAVVMDDKSLGKTLIGMSMLRQLARFEVKNEVLYIEQ
jgi:aspartyl protease family protein